MRWRRLRFSLGFRLGMGNLLLFFGAGSHGGDYMEESDEMGGLQTEGLAGSPY